MGIRLYARVGPITGQPQTVHHRGFPIELTGGVDYRKPMPWALVVLLEEDGPDGSVMLYRYADNGEFAGDTRHEGVEDALHQAEFEYGAALGGWQAVPNEVVDAKRWVRGQLP